MGQTFTVRGKLVESDLLPAVKYSVWRLRPAKILFAFGCIAGAVVVGDLAIDPKVASLPNLFYPTFLLVLLIGWPHFSLRMHVKAAPAILEEGDFTFDDEGFTVVGASSHVKVLWKGVDCAVEFPGQFAIYTSKIHCRVVAKRFFDSEQLPAFRAFLERILKENGKTLKVAGK